MICTYCGSETELTKLSKVHGKYYADNPKIWYCENCDAYVRWSPSGADGTFADYALRQQRIMLHVEFDKLWKEGSMTRSEAYVWLARVTKTESRFAHIRYLNEEQCNQVMEALCKRLKN